MVFCTVLYGQTEGDRYTVLYCMDRQKVTGM
jgi:hypothetical protein